MLIRAKTHIVLDLETIGQSTVAPIVQIAAVVASHHDPIPCVARSFDRRVALTDEDLKKFSVDINTIEWWLAQSKEAQSTVFAKEGRVSLRQTITDFSFWASSLPGEKVVWSHATFDPPVLENAYRVLGLECPIHRRDFLDLRTILRLAGDLKSSPKKEFGEAHTAPADARYEAHQLIKAFEKVGYCG